MAGANTTVTPPDGPAGSSKRVSLAAEQERQLRELLEHCPAALCLVDEDGRLVFHNARLRELLGYDEEELHLFDTRDFWHDLGHRDRLIETLRERGGQTPEPPSVGDETITAAFGLGGDGRAR